MMSNSRAFVTTRKRSLLLIAAIVACIIVFAAMHRSGHTAVVDTAEVAQGEFVDSLRIRGELKVLKTIAITAPPDAGNLRIVSIAQDGSHVNQGDKVVEFDASKMTQDLAQSKSILASSEAEIKQTRAQGSLTEEADTTALIKAGYDLQAAKLEASKKEIVSHIEGEEAQLKVEEAEQKLHEAEKKLGFDRASNDAGVNGKHQAREKTLFDMHHAESSLTSMVLVAPANGTLTLLKMWHQGGRQPFRPGEQVWPGAPIAEIPDLSTIRISARVDETERGRLRVGQPVSAQLDAISDRQLRGHIAKISTVASVDFASGWPFPRNFDLEIVLDETDPKLRPGMNAQLTVELERVQNAITIPVEACFQKAGKTVVYVQRRNKFEEREVEVLKRNSTAALVNKGLRPGDHVALKDPTLKEQ